MLQTNTLRQAVEINCILVCSSLIYSSCPPAYYGYREMWMMSWDYNGDGGVGDCSGGGGGDDGNGDTCA